MKLMLIEDSKFIRSSIEKALRKAGHEVAAASNGEEALPLAKRQLPDAILLDLLLPKMSGLEVLRALKSDKSTCEIPIIVLTSLSQKNAARLEKDGAAAFIEKTDLMFSDKPAASFLETVERVIRCREEHCPNPSLSASASK
jgi:CheY-like chemotaxis protein